MSTSSCSNDEPQHHRGDDHSAASTDQNQLGSDNVDIAVEESRSESTDHNEKKDVDVLEQMKQDYIDHEASSIADLVLREQSAREEIAAESSSLATVIHTSNADLADDEVSLATTRVTLKEVKPDIETPNGIDSESIFSAVSAYLTKCKDKVSALSNKVTLLEEEKERRDRELFRMQENNKLLFSEVQRLLRCLKEVNSGVATPNGEDPAVVFSTVRAYLTKSKNNQSTLPEKLTLLEVENDKKSEDLGIMKVALEQAKAGASTAEDNLEWCSLYYTEMQEALETTKKGLEQLNSEESSAKDIDLDQSKAINRIENAIMGIDFPQKIVSRGIARKIRWLVAEHEKTCEDLDRMKAGFGQAHKDLDECMLEKRKISEDLDVANSKLKQAILEASSAKDEHMKCSQELQKSNSSLEAAQMSLADHKDMVSEKDKVIGDMKKAILGIDFPPEIVSWDFAHKVRWLADEHRKTCEDLRSTKADLEQANCRADATKEELETSKLNLEQANLKASRELGAMKLNSEQAKSELKELCTELKAAELKVRVLEEIQRVISPISFPKETQSMDTLTSVKRLADYYKNCTNTISGSNPEETKRLLISVKANIHRKIVDELLETVTVIVEEAVEEATRVEDPNPEAPSSAVHTGPTNITGATSNEQDRIHDMGKHSGSGERTVIETTDEAAREEDSNHEVSSSAIMADPSHRELAQQHSGSGERTSVGLAGIRDILALKKQPTAINVRTFPRNMPRTNNQWRLRGPTIAPAVSRSEVRPPVQSNNRKPSRQEGSMGKSGDHNA